MKIMLACLCIGKTKLSQCNMIVWAPKANLVIPGTSEKNTERQTYIVDVSWALIF